MSAGWIALIAGGGVALGLLVAVALGSAAKRGDEMVDRAFRREPWWLWGHDGDPPPSVSTKFRWFDEDDQ